MTASALTPMSKIEVVVSTADAPDIAELIRSVGARGYTTVTGVSGVGHHGAHGGRMLFNDQDTLTLLITVVPVERTDAIVSGIRPLLDRVSGVMFVSATSVSRPDYFT